MPDEIANAVICAPVNVGTRKRRRSNIGDSCRSSTVPKATSRAAPAAKRPMTRPLDQPQSLPRKSPSTSANRPAVSVTSPPRSSPRRPSSRVSCNSRNPPATQATPIGMLTKKIQRQPTYVVSAPPTRGPIATAIPIVAPQIPKAVPRSRPWNSWEMIASETANIPAPPIPCAPRATISQAGDCAAPHRAEAAVKRPIAIRNTRLRPRRSPSEPALSIVAASVSAYASTTHCRSVKEVFSSLRMSGSATLTTVMSRSSMNTATHTTMRTRHFRSITGKLTKQESATALRKVSRDGAHAVTSASGDADDG